MSPPERPSKEGPYGLANEAISSIDDAKMRSAFLAVRSEFYHVWDRVTSRTVELQQLIAETSSQLQSYSKERNALDKADAQRQESLEHVFREFVTRLDKHLAHDEEFQKGVNGTFEGWERRLIALLISIIGALIITIAVMFWQVTKH